MLLFTVCFIWGQRLTNNSCRLNRLFTESLIYRTSAASRLKQHADKSDFHKNCVATMPEFVKVMEHKISANTTVNGQCNQRKDKGEQSKTCANCSNHYVSWQAESSHCEIIVMTPQILILVITPGISKLCWISEQKGVIKCFKITLRMHQGKRPTAQDNSERNN